MKTRLILLMGVLALLSGCDRLRAIDWLPGPKCHDDQVLEALRSRIATQVLKNIDSHPTVVEFASGLTDKHMVIEEVVDETSAGDRYKSCQATLHVSLPPRWPIGALNVLKHLSSVDTGGLRALSPDDKLALDRPPEFDEFGGADWKIRYTVSTASGHDGAKVEMQPSPVPTFLTHLVNFNLRVLPDLLREADDAERAEKVTR